MFHDGSEQPDGFVTLLAAGMQLAWTCSASLWHTVISDPECQLTSELPTGAGVSRKPQGYAADFASLITFN